MKHRWHSDSPGIFVGFDFPFGFDAHEGRRREYLRLKILTCMLPKIEIG